jgi:hypothetical protein
MNATGRTIGSSLARRHKRRLRSGKASLIADERGAIAFETIIVYAFMCFSLLLPLADVAVAGLKYNAAYQALRDMGQRTQYSSLDTTDSSSISTWQSSLPTTVDGYTISAAIKCGDAGTAAPCTGTTFPKYFTFQTTFSLSPMVLSSVLCSTCTVSYSQRFQ